MSTSSKVERLVFVTGNEDKAREARKILGINVTQRPLDLKEIQSMDLEEVTREKAQEAFRRVKEPLIVDDVGFYLSAWEGFPGPFIKYLQKVGNETILRMLAAENDRKATVKAAIGFCDGKITKVFKGEDQGEVSKEIRGKEGWGFDFIYIPEGYAQTYAELGPEVKNKISHRRKALENLRSFLYGP